MNISERLLKLAPLEVRHHASSGYSVGYAKCCKRLGKTFIMTVSPGHGKTFEDACEDYLSHISGETLVFNPQERGKYDKEVTVL